MEAKNFISTKYFSGYPCTHRQWKAKDSHCRFIHGYSRAFYFEFAAKELTKEGWVVDFGGLKEIKDWLEYMFDHTFLANEDDPYLDSFRQMDKDGVIQLRIFDNIGMEGTAKYVFEEVDKVIRRQSDNRAWVHRVEVRENEKNSAFYQPHSPVI
mgnify:CR=1 FL=1